jgi:hypothetical protein
MGSFVGPRKQQFNGLPSGEPFAFRGMCRSRRLVRFCSTVFWNDALVVHRFIVVTAAGVAFFFSQWSAAGRRYGRLCAHRVQQPGSVLDLGDPPGRQR